MSQTGFFEGERREVSNKVGGFFGIITVPEVTNQNQPVWVILPEFDTTLKWGPCKWQSRDAEGLPSEGDQCLLVFDNRQRPWVVAWWPFNPV